MDSVSREKFQQAERSRYLEIPRSSKLQIMRYGYVALAVISVLACAHAEELYSDKYDYVNIEEILGNNRLREQYYKCFMNIGPCVTPDAAFFKGNLIEAFVTKCKKCTELQKQHFDRMADWYSKNEPAKWNAFVEKALNDAKSKRIAAN